MECQIKTIIVKVKQEASHRFHSAKSNLLSKMLNFLNFIPSAPLKKIKVKAPIITMNAHNLKLPYPEPTERSRNFKKFVKLQGERP